MHCRTSLIIAAGFLAVLPSVAGGKPDRRRGSKLVPTIESVVASEGFTPTLSQSEVYRPGAVLVPNGLGAHDMVVEDCIGGSPSVSYMSESSIATTLSAGVSTRLAAQLIGGNARVERRLTFVDPEQRTLALAELAPRSSCVEGVAAAGRFQSLSEAVVVYDVLLAVVKNTTCVRVGADGRVVELAGLEAEGYLECVKESDVQVPLGYKAVPLAKVLEATPVADIPPLAPVVAPTEASAPDRFADVGDALDVDARLAEKACAQQADTEGTRQRTARLAALADAQRQAGAAAWDRLSPELERCRGLVPDERRSCLATIDRWLAAGTDLIVSLPAGVETVQTACGPREAVFNVASAVVEVAGRDAAERLRAELVGDPRIPDAGDVARQVGLEWVALPAGAVNGTSVAAFSLARTEVTVAQYGACMDAGACTAPRDAASCTWNRPDHAAHPVTCVSRAQAEAFATWVGARLPTEAEWAYAAGSAQGWKHPWGPAPASCARAVMAEGGRAGCGRDDTWPVCSHPDGHSAQGVCDLAGNVWEWVAGEPSLARGGGAAQARPEDVTGGVRLRGDAGRQDVYVGFRVAR